jgi:hypothetical protein
MAKSNQRWCSDGFEIRCDNGEPLRVTFALDCCLAIVSALRARRCRAALYLGKQRKKAVARRAPVSPVAGRTAPDVASEGSGVTASA